jgi:hypothetical protein
VHATAFRWLQDLHHQQTDASFGHSTIQVAGCGDRLKTWVSYRTPARPGRFQCTPPLVAGTPAGLGCRVSDTPHSLAGTPTTPNEPMPRSLCIQIEAGTPTTHKPGKLPFSAHLPHSGGWDSYHPNEPSW